ncbi:unnamed protein product [Urochloa decumbens]|uniref:Protein kinase domain-containing protein n=1 Tax=Urochloa decumbens TaxID=240449 RepID=A0ABC9FPM2_9POAL
MDYCAKRGYLERMLINDALKPKALAFSLLVRITSGFSDEKIIGRGASAKVYKGSIGNRSVAVKKLIVAPSQESQFKQEIECMMRVKHKNIVRFLGYCSESQGSVARYNGILVMADTQQRLLCFEYLPRGSLDKYITDASDPGLEWKECYQIINGICQGLHQLHKDNILHMDLKPGNILLDDNMVPKIADFGISRCMDENQSRVHTENQRGSWGYWAPEHVNNGDITKKCDLYSLGVIIMEILTGSKKCPDHGSNDVVESWINRLGEAPTNAQLEQIRVCAQLGIECMNQQPDKRPSDMKDIIDRLEKAGGTQEIQESGKLLHVQPTVLLFDMQPGKLIPCSLQLTNNTDEHIVFKLETTERVKWSQHFMTRLPLYGIVTARSTYTLVLTVLEWDVPDERFCDMILQSCTSSYDFIWKVGGKLGCAAFFEVKKTENAVNEVKLTAFLSEKKAHPISEPTGPGVKILSVEKPRTPLLSMDAHPSKPWIITGHACGHVRIWNHQTTAQRLLYSFKVSLGSVFSVKFIARKQWFISSSAEGLIHVYSYETKMQKLKSFRAHDGPISLAVHPTQPYVLSSPYYAGHHEKRLWDWNKGWECTRTFETEYFTRDLVCQVAFDPKETNDLFASASSHTVKVWSLDSSKSNYTLPGFFDGVNVLEFYTRDDQQYLIIISSNDNATKVWDMQKKEYVANNKLQTLSPVDSVFSHPNLPILLTPSASGAYFWSPKDFR